MKRLAVAAVVAASLSVGGCVTPLVQPAPLTLQKKVDHAVNVQQLANSVARKFALRVKTADKPVIYVAPGPGDMPFAGAFKNDLEQALMGQGFAISRTALNAEVVNFEVQPFLYGADNQKHLVDYWSFWTTWANIGWQISQGSHSRGTAFAEAGVIGPILDVLDSMDQATPAEVTLTLSVVDANRVYYLDTRNFYVRPADLPFYMTRVPKMAPQMMTADTAGLPVVALPVRAGYGQ